MIGFLHPNGGLSRTCLYGARRLTKQPTETTIPAPAAKPPLSGDPS
jgi:hypothetical protein